MCAIRRLSYHLLNGGDEVRDEAFKYTVKSADDCLSRGVYGDAYEKCVCAYETAQTISEYGVLEKLVTKAISDLNRKHGQFSVVTKKINEISRHRTEQTSVSRSNTNATASAITLENEQEHYASLLKDIEVSLACLKKMQKDPTVPLIKGVSIRNTSSKKQEVKLLGRTSVKWKMSYTDSSPKTSLGPNFSLGGLGSYHRGSIVHKVASQFIRFDDGGGQQSKDSFKMDPSHISLVEEETVDVESKPVVQKEQAQSCIIS